MHNRSIASSILLAAALACPAAVWLNAAAPDAANWATWRGPNHDGISTESGWNPAALTTPRIAWKANVGDGYSGVSIQGKCVFTMGHAKGQNSVICLNIADGKELWRHSYASGPGQYPGPRATPILDGDLVYSLGQEGQLVCLDALKGTVKWQKNLVSDFDAKPPKWGFSATPIVDGERLLVNAGTHGIALDKKTGKKEWASPGGIGGYAPPVIYKAGAKRRAVIFGAKAVYGVDPATGQKIWSHPWETSYDVNAPDPIVEDQKVFISSGYGKGCALLDVAGDTPKVLWQNKAIAAHFSSCVLDGGNLYGVNGNTGKGQLKCLDFRLGTEKWSKDLGFGAFMVADRKIIFLNEKGSLFIAALKPDAYTEIASAKDVLPKTCWTAPVFCRGMIFCRNHKGDIVCVDVSK